MWQTETNIIISTLQLSSLVTHTSSAKKAALSTPSPTEAGKTITIEFA
ncbi:MAG: hypothetical protein ACQCN4_00430 [Candidatus Bathyarchaeia archaeon]